LNDPRFGTRMKGEGAMAKMIGGLFAISRTKAGLSAKSPTPSASAFRRPGVAEQATLFDGLGE